MNSFEAIFRANPELIEALNHARDKNQRLPNIAGANSDLLAKRWSQIKGIAELQHRLTRFNVFTALNVMDYETRHSNFLAWLLDPNGTHGFRTRFLNGFVSLIVKKRPNDSATTRLHETLRNPDGLKDARVVREFKRADLLVVDRTRGFVCLVENKIHTGEHSDQLTRYRRIVEAEFPGLQPLFVFLTLSLRPESPSNSAYVSPTYAELCGELKRLTEVRETVSAISPACVRATAPPSLASVVASLASPASRCTATFMLGPNVPRPSATRNGSRRRLWAIIDDAGLAAKYTQNWQVHFAHSENYTRHLPARK